MYSFYVGTMTEIIKKKTETFLILFQADMLSCHFEKSLELNYVPITLAVSSFHRFCNIQRNVVTNNFNIVNFIQETSYLIPGIPVAKLLLDMASWRILSFTKISSPLE